MLQTIPQDDGFCSYSTHPQPSIRIQYEQIVISTNKGEPLAGSNTTSGNAYIDICKRILGDSIPLTDYNTSIRRNPFKRLFRKKHA